MKTHKQSVLRHLGLPMNTHLSLQDLSELTGVPYDALHECYVRGIGAWRTNIRSVRLLKDFSKNPDTVRYQRSARLSKEQWAMARVYSFLDKGTDFYTADADIARRYNIV
jgi:hypothetical protein